MNAYSRALVILLLGASLFIMAFSDLTLAEQLEQPEQSLPIVSIPVEGLVAQYTFSGNTRDTSGNGFHCTRHGPVATADRSGNPNAALSFDGIDDFVECPNSPRLGVHQGVDMTVSLWVRPESITGGKGVISKYLHFSPDISEFFVDLEEAGTTRVTGQGFDVVDGMGPRLNVWSHIVVVFRGTIGNATIYVRGRESITGPLTFNPNAGPRPLLIGMTQGPDFIVPFDGNIDDVRIYERALTSEEIRALQQN